MPDNPGKQDQLKRSYGEKNLVKVKKILNDASKDSAVKEALKKEKQPVSTDDLSAVHNTTEIGTSGGDQRASEDEQKPVPEKAKTQLKKDTLL